MSKRNHIKKGDSSWCGDTWEIKFDSLDEAFGYIENCGPSSSQEDDPCGNCLRVIANHCLDELGYKKLEEW